MRCVEVALFSEAPHRRLGTAEPTPLCEYYAHVNRLRGRLELRSPGRDGGAAGPRPAPVADARPERQPQPKRTLLLDLSKLLGPTTHFDRCDGRFGHAGQPRPTTTRDGLHSNSTIDTSTSSTDAESRGSGHATTNTRSVSTDTSGTTRGMGQGTPSAQDPSAQQCQLPVLSLLLLQFPRHQPVHRPLARSLRVL